MYRLDQELYGLSQSGREWNEELDGWMKSMASCRVKRSRACTATPRDAMAFVLIFVDDVVITTNSEAFKYHPTEQHLGALKRVIRYLLGTVGKGITYRDSETCEIGVYLQGHSDSDWADDMDNRKSTTWYVFTLVGGAISWASRRQTIVAQSTAEAEYIAACDEEMEGKTLTNILDEMLPEMKRKITLGVDNHSSCVMVTNPTFGRRTRHIELKWHYVREQVRKKEVHVSKVRSEDNPADSFTKPLAKARFESLSVKIGMCTRNAQS
ncbi:hypothetical protein ON010_g2685 [Phytophthora cinnamomi]|nr:hypothetical protein ON010_g2685 [Phytophthora cinnamomi]